MGGHHELKTLDHEVEPPVPAVKEQVARQGLPILKKGLTGREGLPDQAVLVIRPSHHRMEQERQEIQRE